MAHSLTGDKQFNGDVVRLAELTVTTNLLEGYTFSNCQIIGPGVLLLLNNVNITNCGWDAPDGRAIFWIIEPGRTFVVGGIGVQNCTFSACQFRNVGVAGDENARQMLLRGFV